MVVQVLLCPPIDPRVIQVDVEDGRKNAEQQRRRELEAGFHNIKEVRRYCPMACRTIAQINRLILQS